MKTALIAALCASALIQSAPSPADARERMRPAPVFTLGSVAFKKLPKPAQEALLDYRREQRAQPYRCYGLSEKAFAKRVGLLAPSDYNGDGVADYLFNSPCRPRELPAGANILMSNPLGYEVARRFDAFVGVVNGQAALLVETPCEGQASDETDDRICYLGRIWDRSSGRWAGAQRVSLAADGSGFIVEALERPRPAPARPIVVRPLAAPPTPPLAAATGPAPAPPPQKAAP